jgi:hypothetical protein
MADGAPTAANRTLPLRQPNKALQREYLSVFRLCGWSGHRETRDQPLQNRCALRRTALGNRNKYPHSRGVILDAVSGQTRTDGTRVG